MKASAANCTVLAPANLQNRQSVKQDLQVQKVPSALPLITVEALCVVAKLPILQQFMAQMFRFELEKPPGSRSDACPASVILLLPAALQHKFCQPCSQCT